jgi:hypothetical protein
VISRVVLGVVLAIVMIVVGPSTYLYLARHQSKIAVAPENPTAATPRPNAFTLPGTIYLAQSGALYSLSAGRFHQLTAEVGWTQPSLSPDGSYLVAVRQSAMYSDVYYLNLFGQALEQVTHNSVPAKNADPAAYHWSFYPRLSPDSKTLWMSYDQPKFGYDVVLSVWAMPANGTIKQGHIWTNAIDYTGGDTQPVPVPTGGIIYTKYSYVDQKLIGQLWFTNRIYSVGRPLTSAAEDCASPALSPDGRQLAMVCSYGKQISYLVIAPWNGSTIGPRTTVINDQLVAQPAWAPDGSGIAYLAPATPDGPFQLWWVPKGVYAPPPPPPTPPPTPGGPHNGPLPSPSAGPTPAPAARKQITTNLGFDATSPLAWAA